MVTVDLETKFNDSKEPFQVVIVRDMLPTGSDAPCQHTMYGYPPDLQEEAVKTVLQQAELLCADWV